MSFGTLELLVEINQSKANSSAKSVASSMSAIIKDSLKDSTKDIFDSFVGDSKSASDSVKANLSSILSIVTVLKKDISSVFTPQSLKVTLETKDLQDRLKAIQAQKKELEFKTVIEIKADITQAKNSIESLQKSLDILKSIKTLDLHIDTAKATKSVDALDKALTTLSKKGSIEVKANIEKALGSVQLINKDLDRIANRENIELKLSSDKAKQELDLLSKELDRLTTRENLDVKLNADKAKQELDLVSKELDRIATRDNVELKLNADRAKQELDLLSKDLDRLATRENLEFKLNADKAKQELDLLSKELDRLATRENVELKISADKAKQELDLVSKELDRLAARENVELKLTADKAKQELDLFSKELDRLAARENLELKLNADKAKQELDLLSKELDRIATRENLDVKLNADKAKQELDLLSKDLDRLATRENVELKLSSDRAKQELDLFSKELDRLATRENVELKLSADKAKQELDLFSKELDRLATRENVELKLSADKAKQELDLLSKDLDRLATRENIELKIDAENTRKDLDLISKELDRIQSKVNLELKIEADKAKQELDLISKELDRIANRENIILKLDADRVKNEAILISKELDRVATERNIVIKIEARTAENELKRIQKLEDDLQRDIKIQVNLDAKQAKDDARDLQGIRDALAKDAKIRIDLDTRQAEEDLKRLTQQIADTTNSRKTIEIQTVQSNIDSGKASKQDTSGLERDLALTNELNRHLDQLERTRRLNLDSDELKRAETQLNEIHRQANDNINIKFSETGLDKIRSEFASTISGMKNGMGSLGQGVLQGIGQQAFQSFTEGVRGAVGVVGGAIGSFSEFGDSLNKFRTFSGGTEADMKGVSDVARELSMTTSTSASGVAKASIEMVKLGFSATETKDQLKGVVALAESTGMTDMGKAAEIAGAAYSVFGISAEKTADLVSATANNSAASAEDMLQVLSKTGGVAKATGQSIETLSTAFGLMRNSGFTAESAATGLKTALLRLAAPSNEGKAALNTLGVEAYDASGKMKPLLSLLPEFKTAMSGFDDASKADLTRKIFGDRGGPAFLAMMNQSQEKVDELFNKISNSDGSAKSSAEKLLEGLPGAIKRAENSFKNLSDGLGEALEPAAVAILRLGVDVANTLGKGDVFAAIKAGAMEFATYLKDNKKLVTDIVLGIQQLAIAMGTQLTKSAKDFTDYMKANPDAMKTMIADLGSLAVNLGLLVMASFEFGKGFTEAAMSMSSMIEPMTTMFANLTGSSGSSASLAENLGKAAAFMIPLLALGSLVGTISTIASGVSAIVGLFGGWAVLGATVSGIIAGIGSFLAATAVTIGALVAGTITFAEVWAVVLSAINPIALAVVAIGATIYTIVTYTQNWNDVCLGFQQTITDISNWFDGIFKTISDTVRKSEVLNNVWEVIKAVVLAVTAPYRFIFDTVVSLVTKSEFLMGVWNGIKDLATGVGNAFKTVVGGVFDGLIQKAGQLANALKSMMGMGGNNGGGTAVGGSASEGDKYVGAVLSILEAPSREGRVDVAQVIANRTQTNFGGNGGNIRDQAFASGQFQPFFKDIGKNDIQNKDSAIKALQAKGFSAVQAAKELDEFFADVANAGMVSDSQNKVGGRAYFKGTSEQGNMSGDDFLRNKNENFFHHENSDQTNRQVGSISGLFGSAGNSSGFVGGANAIVPTGTLAAQEYGAARGGGREHAGQDFDLGDEDKFQSYIGGTVTQVGDDPGGYFKWLDIFNEKLQRVERVAELDNLNVKVGDRVAPGQVVGSGTNATGVVHYEIRTDADSSGKGGFGKAGTVDPVKYLESLGVIERQGTNLIPKKGSTNSGTSVKEGGHFPGDGHNHGGNGAAVGEANDEISGLRSTVKEDEAAKAEKEADKLAKAQEKLDRKNQKAIESAAKMQDQGLAQKRKGEKEARQVDKDDRAQKIDRELATTTNSDVRSALENKKKIISLSSSESEKIIESEQKLDDLKKAKERKIKDFKSPLEDVKEKAKQMPDYSQAIKDEETLLKSRRKLRDEIEITASLEFDTANKTKNEEQSKVTLIQKTTEAYNKEKRMLEELKSVQEEEDPTQVKKTEFLIRRLDLQQASTLALIEEESKLKKATEARDAYNKSLEKTGGKPDDTLKRLDTEIDNIANKVKDINADKNTRLKIIDLQEIKNAKELAKALEDVKAAKAGEVNASKTNLARARAGVLRKGGDEFGANAIERDAAKKDQTIKNNDRITSDDKRIEDRANRGLPYSIEEIRDFRAETAEINKIEFSQAGSQFKTLGETIGTTFKESVGSALKDVLTGAKSMGEAFQDVVSNMLSKLAELAVNSLLKDLMGGMFSGGGGGGGGMLGGLFGGLFGGGNSEGGMVPSFSMGGMVPNFADGNLSTIGSNRPYLAGEPFRAARNSPIAKALQREGSGGVVSVLKANELVLNPSQTKAFFAMGMDSQLSGSVNNYAEGNLSSFGGSVSTSSSSDNVTIPITINMSGNEDKDKSGLNIPKLQDEVRKTVIAEIQSQQRNGGGLSK